MWVLPEIYPIEIELTDFCWLKCKSCVNPLLKNKGFMSIDDYNKILDYIYKNLENILYVNFSWIWDIFLHRDILLFLDLFIDKFKYTWVSLLIPTKWQSITASHIEVLAKFKDNGINLNVSIWLFSLVKSRHDRLSWIASFDSIIKLIKELKKYKINFSLELLDSFITKKEVKNFYRFLKKIQIWWCIHSYHNFWWLINNIFFSYWKEKCSFNWEKYKIKWFYCSFLPFVSKSWNIYTCSISWKKKDFLVWNMKDVFIRFPNYIDLVNYIKGEFLSVNKCKSCSIYKSYIDSNGL